MASDVIETTCTLYNVHGRAALCLECRGFESHLRQLILLWKSDCLGCAVLLCLVVCLLLPSFSHLSLKHVHTVQVACLQLLEVGIKNILSDKSCHDYYQLNQSVFTQHTHTLSRTPQTLYQLTSAVPVQALMYANYTPTLTLYTAKGS